MNGTMKRFWMFVLIAVCLLMDKPLFARSSGGGRSVYVHSYVRKDGTYVQSYYRSAPGSRSVSDSGTASVQAAEPAVEHKGLTAAELSRIPASELSSDRNTANSPSDRNSDSSYVAPYSGNESEQIAKQAFERAQLEFLTQMAKLEHAELTGKIKKEDAQAAAEAVREYLRLLLLAPQHKATLSSILDRTFITYQFQRLDAGSSPRATQNATEKIFELSVIQTAQNQRIIELLEQLVLQKPNQQPKMGEQAAVKLPSTTGSR